MGQLDGWVIVHFREEVKHANDHLCSIRTQVTLGTHFTNTP